MKRTALAALRCGAQVTALGMIVAGAAAAQTVPAPPPTPETQEPLPAEAPTAPEGAPDPEGPDSEGEVITVTGSRISSGFTAPTPVTVLTNARSESLGIQNVGEALNQLPVFRPSVGPNTQANQGGTVGARLLDLRGLNPQRTLVLVDGRRFVPSTSTGSVDVNLIPSALVERTDIVTGGASATYGSDAVAGVVNFVLNRKLEGIVVEAQAGVSERGDNSSQYLSVAGGTAIGSSMRLIFGAEYENNGGLGQCNSREFCRDVNSIVANPAVGRNNLPANLIVLGGANVSTQSPGGLINSSLNAAGRAIYPTVLDPQLGILRGADPLRGITFNDDGSTRPFNYGTLVGSLYMIGGEGAFRNPYVTPFLLQPPVERITGYTSLQADLSDTIKATVDLSYGRVKGHVVANVFRDFNGSLMGTIRSGNPFIPAPVQQIMTDNNIAGFVLGRAGFDLGPAEADTETQTYRGVVAFEGQLGGGWKWDAGYEYGRTKFRQDGYNTVNIANMRNAVDAVRNSAGAIVCRINQTTVVDAACAPINLFGENRFTQAARDYVIGNSFQTTDYQQHDVTANVAGSLFDLPAGPLGIAVGAEYRRDSISGDADPVSRTNGYFQLNGSAIQSGFVEVKEVYGEAEVPVLRDSPLGEALTLNGAIRRADYSTSGGATTWKVGGVYEPISAIRLRATRSRDIRAPNLQELRGPTTRSTATLIDPLRPGQNVNPVVFSGSNPDLTPEIADSFTAGIVLAPRSGWFSRTRLSIDYYNIRVQNVIAPIGTQSIVTGCVSGNTALCDLVTREPAGIDPGTGQSIPGVVSQVRDIVLNSARLRTRGFDIEFQHRQPLGAAGELNLQLLANITTELVTPDGFDRAGQTGFRATTIPGAPDYTLDGLLSWKRGIVSLTGHARYIPDGIYSVNFVDPSQEGYAPVLPATGPVQSVNNNRLPDRFYLDLATNVAVPIAGGRAMEVFGSVNNVLDQDPPKSPSATGGTNQILFDAIGRTFKVGVRVRFGG